VLANVFCGVLWCFAGVLWCFAGVLRCFASVLQYFHKTHKTPAKSVLLLLLTIYKKHRKKTLKNTKNSQYARVLRAFSKRKSKKIDCVAQNTFHKTSAKHRKTPQNTAKQSQNAFCEITSQNTAKQTQNAQKSHKTVVIRNTAAAIRIARIRCIFQILDLSQKYTMRNTRKLRGVSRTPAGSHGFSKNSVLRCFAFCGVLRCFAVFCVRVFSVFHKTAQKRPKNLQNAQNEQNTLCAIQRNTVLCVFLSLRNCLCRIRELYRALRYNLRPYTGDKTR